MLDTSRIELSKMRLQKAQREHKAALVNMEAGFFDVANTRAYYCAFHSIRTVLALDGVDFKSHSRTIGYFNEHYIHKGIFAHEYGKTISFASTSRNKCDYEDRFEATLEETEQNISDTGKFLAAVERYIEVMLETMHNDDEVCSFNEYFEYDYAEKAEEENEDE